MCYRGLKAVDVKAKLVDAEPVLDVKPIIENRHVPDLRGRRNPVIFIGSARVRTEAVETEDVKPRGTGHLKNRRKDDQVLPYRIVFVLLSGLS